jgi:NCS1 family nucleobase:cation symporter-1
MQIETRSIDYIPLAERHGKVSELASVWFAGGAQLGCLATGVVGIAAGLNLAWNTVAILLGSALGTFFMAFHSTQGPQLGLPQMIQSRPQFGRRGALLVWGVALVNYIGYNAFSQVLAGQTMHELARIEPHVTLAVFTGASLVIAIFGYDSIHAVQRPLSYLLMVCMLIFSIGTVILHVPFGDLSQASFKAVPFLTQLFTATAYQLSWSIYVSDYSRYLPRDVGVAASFLWTYFGALLGGAWMMEVGALVAVMNPHLEVAAAIIKSGDSVVPGLGMILLAAAAGGLLTVTSINLYGGSLTLLSAADSIRTIQYTRQNRIYSLLLIGVLSTAVALMIKGDYVSGFSDLLTILLYLFTPWTSINLIDFYFVRRGCYSIREIFRDDGMYGYWNWRGLAAYAAGFTAMIPFFSTGFYVGPIARRLGGADLAMIIGLPVSAITYLLACRSMDLTAERSRAIEADRGLEVDVPRQVDQFPQRVSAPGGSMGDI